MSNLDSSPPSRPRSLKCPGAIKSSNKIVGSEHPIAIEIFQLGIMVFAEVVILRLELARESETIGHQTRFYGTIGKGYNDPFYRRILEPLTKLTPNDFYPIVISERRRNNKLEEELMRLKTRIKTLSPKQEARHVDSSVEVGFVHARSDEHITGTMESAAIQAGNLDSPLDVSRSPTLMTDQSKRVPDMPPDPALARNDRPGDNPPT
ncbi:hypothetical protein BJ878DRAFT_573068 [Calycina marina]|uniref:Uncharacterized protein n=1 Tax=Calycina marina TaxID=1763456 RepID=A0A9P7Z987_9HELO|nr:hypothetical protein BJ878DRAFT_573068 [Calycina marina]